MASETLEATETEISRYETWAGDFVERLRPFIAEGAAHFAEMEREVARMRAGLKGDASLRARTRRGYPFDGLPIPPGLVDALRSLDMAARNQRG